MTRFEIVVDTLDLKDKLQSSVTNIRSNDVSVYIMEDQTTHFFDMRELEEGKYVYYEASQEKICQGYLNTLNMKI